MHFPLLIKVADMSSLMRECVSQESIPRRACVRDGCTEFVLPGSDCWRALPVVLAPLCSATTRPPLPHYPYMYHIFFIAWRR